MNRRPKLDVLESRTLLTGVVPTIDAPSSDVPSITMAVVGPLPPMARSLDFRAPGAGFGAASGAGSGLFWNPSVFGGGQADGSPQYAWSRAPGGAGDLFHHDFADVPFKWSWGAPPTFSSSGPAAPDGPLMFAPRRGPFSDAPFRRDPNDGLPMMTQGRDLPFPMSRGASLAVGMLGLQFAQEQLDQADRETESDSTPAATSTTTDATVATVDVGGRTAGPVGQQRPALGGSARAGLSMSGDDPNASSAPPFGSPDLQDRVTIARRDGLATANASPDDKADDSGRLLPSDGEPEEALKPHAAGLMAQVLPFDHRSLERAVDQLLDQLHELNIDGFAEPSSIRILVATATVVSAGVVAEVGRRRLDPRRRRGRLPRAWDANESEELLGFPELPGSWSTRWS